MAIVKDNVWTKGLSGMVGDAIVFSQKGGQTIVSFPPTPSSLPATEAQNQQRDRFKEATAWARLTLANVAQRQTYQAKATGNLSAFNLAVRDYLVAPTIEEVDLSSFDGSLSATLQVLVTDDFAVADVQVTVFNGSDALMENGPATRLDGSDVWVYTANLSYPDMTGFKVRIEATDGPGNQTIQEVPVA